MPSNLLKLKQSLTLRVLGLILAIFFFLFAIALFFAQHFSINAQQAIATQFLQQQVLITKERTESFFEREQKLIEFGLRSGVFQAWMKEPDNQEKQENAIKDLHDVCNVTDCFGWFLIAHGSKKELVFNKVEKFLQESRLEPSDMVWYSPILDSKKDVYIDSSITTDTNVHALFLDYVIRENDKVLGIVGTYEYLEDILSELLQRESPNAINLIVDHEKQIHALDAVSPSEKNGTVFSPFSNNDWASLFSKSLRTTLDQQSKGKSAGNGLYEITVNSEEFLAVFEYIDAVDWYAVSLYPSAKLRDNESLATFMVASLVILILCLTITLLGLNNLVISPLGKLNNAVKSIQQGNYNAKVGDIGLDIIHNLARGIDEMSSKIKEQIESLNISNEQLQFESKKAEDASEAKSRFLSNMSHEIRTPLNGIFGTLQLIQNNQSDVKSKKLVDNALASAKSLLVIINDILDFSKVEANELILEKSPFSFIDILNSVVFDIKTSPSSSNIYINSYVDTNFVDGWLGDSVRTKQVLLNLVSNAAKFTDNGRVSIRVLEKNEQLCFEVSDTGIGMSKEFQGLIFKRFSQADSSTTRRYGGTGLGMTITMNLIKLMQGSIDIESEEGVGTTIKVSLPLEKTQLTSPPNNENQRPQVPNLAKYKILIAEDSEINQAVIESMLATTKASLTIVENGEQAVFKCQENQYDLVLMDIQMPIMDGEEAFTQIKKLDNDIPIAALTANTMDDEVARYKALGFTAHIGKPIIMDLLYRELTKILKYKEKSNGENLNP